MVNNKARKIIDDGSNSDGEENEGKDSSDGEYDNDDDDDDDDDNETDEEVSTGNANKKHSPRNVRVRNNDSDSFSQTTETEVLTEFETQKALYDGVEKETYKKDTEKTIQRYMKKVFRQVKFLTDSGKEFKEPNFVAHVHGIKSQAVQICEYLWSSLGKKLV